MPEHIPEKELVFSTAVRAFLLDTVLSHFQALRGTQEFREKYADTLSMTAGGALAKRMIARVIYDADQRHKSAEVGKSSFFLKRAVAELDWDEVTSKIIEGLLLEELERLLKEGKIEPGEDGIWDFVS